MSDRTDEDDLAGSLRGDGEAYARLIARHQVAVARRMRKFSRQPTVVEELVHEVFVDAYRSLASYRGQGAFAAWLDRIATRTGYRYWKRSRWNREVLFDERWWREVCAAPSDTDDAGRAAVVVHGLLAKLPPRDRLVLLLLYVEGRSVREAADLAGWSRTMVHVQAFRARGKLKKRLAELGIESLEDALGMEADAVAKVEPGASPTK